MRQAICALILGMGLGSVSVSHGFTTLKLTDGFYSEAAAFGDFDHDGVRDIVSGPFWYEGPDFTLQHAYYAPVAFSIGGYSDNFFTWVDDLDGDGWDDILVGGFPGEQLTWYRNPQGQPGFWTPHVVFDGLDNESPHYVDLTGDGVRELVFHHQMRWGFASPQPGAPELPWTFQPVTPVGPYPTFTHGMGVGDINGDGRMDILERTGWWEHPSGDLTAQPWTQHPYDFSPFGLGGGQMYAYDFDGDGDADVVASSQAHGFGLYWFEQVDSGGRIDFVTHTIIDATLGSSPAANPHGVNFSQLHALELVDIDRDGIKDVVTGKRFLAHNGTDPDHAAPAVLYWFKTIRSPGGTHFFPQLIDDDSGVGTQVVAGDVDGDDWADVLVGNKKGAFVFFGGSPECNDGLDNDGDGEVDFGLGCAAPGGSDCGCESADDFSEIDTSGSHPCDDLLDNDGDGARDFPADPGCRSATWPSESPACSDGSDNDLDGAADFDGAGLGVPDPDCLAKPWRTRETTRCAADLDDDGVVGASDFFGVFRPCLGSAVARAPECRVADLDADGRVDAVDFFEGLRPALIDPGRCLLP